MQGNIQPLVQLYDSNERVLAIPVYQRNYDWRQDNCARLFDDLVETIQRDRPNHFFGSIVYEADGLGVFTVIDGQQRLTTVNLLFLALWRAIQNGTVKAEAPERLGEQIYETYLRSKWAKDGFSELKLKLKPVKSDQHAYERLFGEEAYFDESSNVTANYRYFYTRLGRAELTADQVFDAIRRLEVMRLELSKNDDAQLIFESLNSTGLDLSEADMVRNFVLMGQPRRRQEELYDEYWNRIEQLVDYETSAFLRDYLTAQLGRSPRMADVYAAFKIFVRRSAPDIDEVLEEMRDFAQHHHDIRHATVGDVPVDRLLQRFNLVDRTVTLPFLMLVMDDLRNHRMSPQELFDVLQIIDTYLARRWVCGYPTNALNKIFALLYRETRKLVTDGTTFRDVLIHRLTKREGSGAFPDDQIFEQSLASKDFYNVGSGPRNYFWESLENGTSKDVRDIAEALTRGDISVEHIMPQTLTAEWREELGPEHQRVHDTWLHRLGNLTVTAYNSSYSNSPFHRKRDREEGFGQSPYRLNELVRNAKRWTEQEMSRRSDRLRNLAMQYWPMPTTAFQPPSSDRDVEPMGEDTVFKGRKIHAWEFQGSVTVSSTWKQMLIQAVSHFAESHSAEVHRLAATGEKGLGLFVDEAAVPKWHSIAAPGIHVWSSNDTASKIWILRELLKYLGIDSDELVFHLVPETTETEADAAPAVEPPREV